MEQVKLKLLIDEYLYRPSTAQEVVNKLYKNLSFNGKFLLAAWDAAAVFGPETGKVRILMPNAFDVTDNSGNLYFHGEGFEGNQTGNQALVIVPDINFYITSMDNPVKKGNESPHKHEASSLIRAMQFARDEMDESLSKTRKERMDDWETYAKISSVSIKHFRELYLWYNNFSKFIEEW